MNHKTTTTTTTTTMTKTMTMAKKKRSMFESNKNTPWILSSMLVLTIFCVGSCYTMSFPLFSLAESALTTTITTTTTTTTTTGMTSIENTITNDNLRHEKEETINISSPPKTTNHHRNVIFWCEGSREASQPQGRFFSHFPHAMEFIAQCWSWWMTQLEQQQAEEEEQEEESQQTQQPSSSSSSFVVPIKQQQQKQQLSQKMGNHCGIIMDRFVEQRLLFRANTDWIVKLLEILKCQIRGSSSLSLLNHTNHKNDKEEDIDKHFAPNMTSTTGPFRMGHVWVNQPHHAWALRDVLLQQYNIPLQPRRSHSTLRIGFVNRMDTRSILNMHDIMRHVYAQFDRISIDLTWFTTVTPMEDQIAWFASHDIIVGAHGAVMTNCLYLQPNTVVIELFPPNYFPVDFFGSLITQVGGIHMPLYTNHTICHSQSTASTTTNTTTTPFTTPTTTTFDSIRCGALRKNHRAGLVAQQEFGMDMKSRHIYRNANMMAHIPDVLHLIDLGMQKLSKNHDHDDNNDSSSSSPAATTTTTTTTKRKPAQAIIMDTSSSSLISRPHRHYYKQAQEQSHHKVLDNESYRSRVMRIIHDNNNNNNSNNNNNHTKSK